MYKTANATPLYPVSPKLLMQPHSTRCHPNCQCNPTQPCVTQTANATPLDPVSPKLDLYSTLSAYFLIPKAFRLPFMLPICIRTSHPSGLLSHTTIRTSQPSGLLIHQDFSAIFDSCQFVQVVSEGFPFINKSQLSSP